MTDQNQTVQEEQDTKDAFEGVDIAQLRKVAKTLGITSQRDWGKVDYIAAIQAKQEALNVEIAMGDSSAPKPGFARVLVHRDPTPGHKNTPIHVGVNGWIFQVPRGIEVDLPIMVINGLKDAITLVTRPKGEDQRGREIYGEEAQLSYPFQIVAITPGVNVNRNDARSVTYERRETFWKKFGRWPTQGELDEAMKHKIRKEMQEE